MNCKGFFNILIFYIDVKMSYLNGDILRCRLSEIDMGH